MSEKEPKEVRLALVQDGPVFLNLSASLAKAERLARDAAAQGADIVVFGECWLSGYPVWLDEAPGAVLWGDAGQKQAYRLLVESAPTLDGPELAALSRLSAELGVDIVIGINERAGSSLYNSAVHFGADGRRNLHRKLMPTYSEKLFYMAADASQFGGWPSRFGPMGALICWEHWMPLARAGAHEGGELIHFALWPAVTELHLLASRHYAFEGQCYVAAVGSCLTRDDLFEGLASLPGDTAETQAMFADIPETRFWLKAGDNVVIAPDATVITTLSANPKETVFTTINLDAAIEGRLYLDTAGHYARPDIFSLHINRSGRSEE